MAGDDSVWRFTGGGTVTASPPFATLAGRTVTGLCIGPSAAIYAATTQGEVFDVSAGGAINVGLPHATTPVNTRGLACDDTHVYLMAQGAVFDVTGGGTVTTPFAFNLVGIFPFGGDIFMGPLGKLFVVGDFGLVDATAGGDMAGAPYYVDGGGELLVSGSSLAGFSFVLASNGVVYDATAPGVLGMPVANAPGGFGTTHLLVSPAGAFVVDEQSDLIHAVSNVGPTVYATGGGVNLRWMTYVPACGDGFDQVGEACDGDGMGNGGETATCNLDCTVASCGDGVVNATAGEACDGDGMGNGGETATCNLDCTAASCGDGVVNASAGEACDGDGMGVGGETATCNADCTVASCGDGLVNATAGETCDGDGMGNGGETTSCDVDCTAAECGDGVVNAAAGEACDDGNTMSGDGCDGSCSVEMMGTGGGGAGGEGGMIDVGGGPDGGGGGASEPICAPGAQVACACPGGDSGAQVCREDGSGYDTCDCPKPAPPAPATTETEGGCSMRGTGADSWEWLFVVAAGGLAARRRPRRRDRL
ncbi:MAG: hypothetical protein R3B72_26880 [Polyangiaceae bacterium]